MPFLLLSNCFTFTKWPCTVLQNLMAQLSMKSSRFVWPLDYDQRWFVCSLTIVLFLSITFFQFYNSLNSATKNWFDYPLSNKDRYFYLVHLKLYSFNNSIISIKSTFFSQTILIIIPFHFLRIFQYLITNFVKARANWTFSWWKCPGIPTHWRGVYCKLANSSAYTWACN